MTRIIVSILIWDTYNRQHIRKHSVTEQEIEIAGKHIIYHRHSYKNRYVLIGKSGTRLLSVVLKRKADSTYYVVTARDASQKERRKAHEKEKE